MSVSIASRAGYNVVALLGQAGQVLEQYVWDPYGTPAVKHTSATPAPVNRVGHQGLFWHSLDGSATFNTPDPAATPTATGLYYNRNRWYAPHLGRFLQRDPNESAMLVLDTLARNGQLAAGLLNAFGPASHFGSGMNLYGYAGSNPITGADPAGLYDPFDEVDRFNADYHAERAASAAAVARYVNTGLDTSALIARAALSFTGWGNVALLAIDIAQGNWASVAMTGGPKLFGTALRAWNRFGTLGAHYGKYNINGVSYRFEKNLLPAMGRMHKHHIFPQGGPVGRWLREKGINVHQWTVELDEFTHLRGAHGNGLPGGPGGALAGKWCKRWEEFMGMNQNASLKDIYQFAGKLMDEFGLSGLPLKPY